MPKVVRDKNGEIIGYIENEGFFAEKSSALQTQLGRGIRPLIVTFLFLTVSIVLYGVRTEHWIGMVIGILLFVLAPAVLLYLYRMPIIKLGIAFFGVMSIASLCLVWIPFIMGHGVTKSAVPDMIIDVITLLLLIVTYRKRNKEQPSERPLQNISTNTDIIMHGRKHD